MQSWKPSRIIYHDCKIETNSTNLETLTNWLKDPESIKSPNRFICGLKFTREWNGRSTPLCIHLTVCKGVCLIIWLHCYSGYRTSYRMCESFHVKFRSRNADEALLIVLSISHIFFHAINKIEFIDYATIQSLQYSFFLAFSDSQHPPTLLNTFFIESGTETLKEKIWFSCQINEFYCLAPPAVTIEKSVESINSRIRMGLFPA